MSVNETLSQVASAAEHLGCSTYSHFIGTGVRMDFVHANQMVAGIQHFPIGGVPFDVYQVAVKPATLLHCSFDPLPAEARRVLARATNNYRYSYGDRHYAKAQIVHSIERHMGDKAGDT